MRKAHGTLCMSNPSVTVFKYRASAVQMCNIIVVSI
jgi:hypothetical protein